MSNPRYRTEIFRYYEGGRWFYSADVFRNDDNLLMETRKDFDDEDESRAWAARTTAELASSKQNTLEPTDREVEAALEEFMRLMDEWREMTDEPAGNTTVWLKVTDKAMRAALIAARKVQP